LWLRGGRSGLRGGRGLLGEDYRRVDKQEQQGEYGNNPAEQNKKFEHSGISCDSLLV